MPERYGFFADELNRYYQQRGKNVSADVLRVLEMRASDLAGEDLETYEKLILPAESAIKGALRYQLERRSSDREEWKEQLSLSGETIIGSMVAEVLAETPQGAMPAADALPPAAPARDTSVPAAEADAEEPIGKTPGVHPAHDHGEQTLDEPRENGMPPLIPPPDPENKQQSLSREEKTQSNRSPGKRILNLLFWAFFSVVCVMLVLLVLSLFNLGVRAFAVSSGSMSPAIEAGALVMVRPSEQYGVGDVITFSLVENVYTTHRVHQIREEGGAMSYVTKGDANRNADADPVNPAQVEGRVVFTIPYLGYMVAFLRSLPGFILIMSAFGILMIVLIRDIFKDMLSRSRPGDK